MKIEELLVEFGRLNRLVAGISTTFSQLCPMSLNLSSVQDEVLLHIYDCAHVSFLSHYQYSKCSHLGLECGEHKQPQIFSSFQTSCSLKLSKICVET